MKKLYIWTTILAASFFTVFADMEVVSLTGGTPDNIFDSGKIIDNITVLASTTNTTILKGYDSSTTTTNVVRAAYTSYASYSTNYSVTFTNASGLLVTNSFTGTYTAPTSNSAVTNERPKCVTLAVPGSAQLSRDLTLLTTRGLTLLSDKDCVVTITYRPTQ
jgi:hypothetical protein